MKHMGDSLKRYAKIWWKLVGITFSISAASRIDFLGYILGKFIRMGFFLMFVIALFSHTQTIAGYDRGEVLLFFTVMNLIDIFVQLLWYRGFTDLQRLINKGDFDLILTKPISPLFWSAFRTFDLFDLTTLPVAFIFLSYAIHTLRTPLDLSHIMAGLFFFILSLILAFSVNVILAAISFWTTELDNAWWIYRDAVYVARFPPEVFPRGVRFVFTCIFPILVIVTFPTKALLGRLSPEWMLWGIIATAGFFLVAMVVWKKALKHYASASA